MRSLSRLAVIVGWVSCAACAGAISRPLDTSSKPATDALVVIPGFGYSSAGERVFRSLAQSMAADGIDLYLPTYVSRRGLDNSRARLWRFIRANRLERYARVHIFAFIAGGWTVNPLVDTNALPNLTSIVYDRSPYQERAPRIAMDRLRLLTWMRYGHVVFDVARTPYPPVSSPRVRIGILVETVPTSFVKRFRSSASRYGPYQFECNAFNQPHDDCAYVALSHDQLYVRFAEVWSDVRSFIRTGQFTSTAIRIPPAADAATGGRQ